MNQRAALALATLAALALATSAFGARETRIDLTIKPASETRAQYKGKITSDEPICVVDRLIKVKSPDGRLVKTRSDEDGRFDELGKRPKSGAKLKLKIVETDECIELIENGRAE